MRRSIVATLVERPGTRFVRPSARHRERRLGLHRAVLTRARTARRAPAAIRSLDRHGDARVDARPGRALSAVRRGPRMRWARGSTSLVRRITSRGAAAWWA